MRRRFSVSLLAVLLAAGIAAAQAPAPAGQPWRFVVAGDSRNCGDIVMPAIATSARPRQPAFYWHLGDLRKIYDFDEDMQHQPEHVKTPMTILDYEAMAWDDFIQNQIAAWGPVPFFIGIGNHEAIEPKNRQQFIVQFADWLDAPVLQQQRLRDDPNARQLRTWYHWVDRGVDFVYLDNATDDQFDATQLGWLRGVLERDAKDATIRSVVVGMHRALPESISADHSMNESAIGVESGRAVYHQLLDLRGAGKAVYVLASHSHFYMEDIFNTAYWRANGGVLPGWIVGTAGAVRYALPPEWKDAGRAETNVYGYMVGTVSPPGDVRFEFQRIEEKDVPPPVVQRYGREFVHWCFAENSEAAGGQ